MVWFWKAPSMTNPEAGFLKGGHWPTPVAALPYFDVSFMVWVLMGVLGTFIAEDLGLITPDVVELRETLGLPGMRVLQFGIGAILPLLLLSYMIWRGTTGKALIAGVTLSACLVLLSVFMMRWNVVIGGQEISKTGKGLPRYHLQFLGHEGPGQQLLTMGGIDMITSGSDARFLLLGGRFVSGDTLLRFYVLHCVALPLAVAVLIAVHFWRVRKDDGISGPL